MLAYQQQQQQQRPSPVAAPTRKPTEPNSVVAVPPASVTAANSTLRFGNTGIASWTIDGSEKPEAATGSQTRAFPKSFGAMGNSYHLQVTYAGDSNNNNESQPLARSQHNSRGSHRNNPDPFFTGKCWENYHKQYNQQQQMRQQQQTTSSSAAPGGGDAKGFSIRR
ncbi:hypothetical protein EV175_006083, partial [Coemansia sp. RSA 1933]